ncbi:MAG: hypothetical protein J5940_07400 [Clostridia bacterium]|nr:hypothetical protein [Clostridia bacterium]
MLKFRPKGKKLNAALVVAASFILGAVCFIFASFNNISYKWAIQIAGIVLAATGVEFVLRYFLTSFAYIVDGKKFVVTKTSAGHEQVICDVTLDRAVAFVPSSEMKEKLTEIENGGKTTVTLNCCVTFIPPSSCTLLIDTTGKAPEDDGKHTFASIVFEPDEEFYGIVADAIESARGRE